MNVFEPSPCQCQCPCLCHARVDNRLILNGRLDNHIVHNFSPQFQHQRWEWVEIIEPKTKEHMYANLTTGECVWDPPPDVKIKKTDDNQWWELFDPNTSRFYYYNATSQKTVWHRPQNCDIIPLAKLQKFLGAYSFVGMTLKQNTEVRDEEERAQRRREIATQTPVPQTQRFQRQDSNSSHSSSSHHDSLKDRSVNGDRVRRRGSQSSQSTTAGYSSSSPTISGGIIRRDSSTEMSPRSMDSPRLHRAQSMQRNVMEHSAPPSRSSSYRYTDHRARDDIYLTHGHPHRANRQGSFTERDYGSKSDSYGTRSESYTPPIGMNPETFMHDLHERLYSPGLSSASSSHGEPECIPFSQDIVNQQGNVSPSPLKPKTRSFPRTNPAYVGVPKRNGTPSVMYKRLNVEQQMSENHPAEPMTYSSAGIQIAPGDYVDNYYYPHERSDSEASHSSTRAIKHERNDSQTSHSSRNRELSDSQSSQGSSRNTSDIHSSQGSLRLQHTHDSTISFQDSVSSRSSARSFQDQEMLREQAGSRLSQNSYRASDTERNTDYANISSKNVPVYPTSYQQDTNHYREVLKDRQNILDNVNYLDGIPISTLEYNQHLDMGHNSVQNSNFQPGVELNESYDEDVNSNVFSSSGIQERIQQELALEMHPASLKRKKNPEMADSSQGSPVIDKGYLVHQPDVIQQRPVSMVVPSQSDANVSLSPSIGSLNRQMFLFQTRAGTAPPIRAASPLSTKQKLPSDSDIENYAQQYMNRHKKGLFGKKVSVATMLTWSKDPIQKPILRTEDKGVKKEACDVFKLIQIYMGDRKGKHSQMQAAQEIVIKGWNVANLRDEIYMQICKQTTENRKEESLQRGWELMAICLNFFPPSVKFYSYLEGYIQRHAEDIIDLPNVCAKTQSMSKLDIFQGYSWIQFKQVPISHFAAQCQRRLDKTMQSGPKKGQRKPTLEEIEQAKKSVFCPSMFGSTLKDVMLLQSDRFPDRQIPWIQVALSEEVLRLNGAKTEGIFRVPGDIDEVNSLKIKCDQWMLPTDCIDPHIPASLLKLWYRELHEPLIPQHFYEECIDNYSNGEAAIEVVNKLPDINRLVLAYLIRFLQVFAAEENSKTTKMDVNNLAMVMAPNCLRCESVEPSVIFENTRKEMGFIRTLIQNLDTSFMEGIV
ncbi:rho GTPase-activating protein 39-like isoform X7 [Argopecten irradians]|uniref:rho GTPase-activating protein 39-like isoform X7 n=1 Tax=Argopecten irradians TaxID=31199 RepID=UPI00371A9707